MDKITIAVISIPILTIPGLFFYSFLSSRTKSFSESLLLVPFLSVSFLVVLIWATDLFKGTFHYLALIFYGLFVMGILANRKGLAPVVPSLKKICWIGAVALVIYFLPFAVRLFPAGADASMHGYITRLLIVADGIPATYLPLFPAEFGSYSAGFSTLASALSAFNLGWIRLGALYGACLSYFLCYLGLVLVLRQFFSSRISYSVALLTVLSSRVPQDSFYWGGNSTALAFALSMAFVAMVMLALRSSDKRLLVVSALTLAAIPLTHAVPAATFSVLAVLGGALMVWEYRRVAKNWLGAGAALVFFTVVFLTPFLLRIEPADEVFMTKIRQWQAQMGPDFSGGYLNDALATWEAIKYRLGDAFFILGVLGSGYWILPGSFLLYPERIVFFMIVPLSYYLCLVWNWAEAKLAESKGRRNALWAYSALVLLFGLGLEESHKYYLKVGLDQRYNEYHLEAFLWINEHLSPQAAFRSDYYGPGVWLPAMTGRPTIGLHLHFLHSKYLPWIEQIPEQYLFVTSHDRNNSTPLLEEIPGRELVYENDEVWIYR
jgi:hypothetical protein